LKFKIIINDLGSKYPDLNRILKALFLHGGCERDGCRVSGYNDLRCSKWAAREFEFTKISADEVVDELK